MTLAKEGIDVNLVISHDKNEVVEGVNIVALSQRKNRLYRVVIKTTAAFFKALKTKSKIFHLHDPELIFIGFLLRILGKKVVYDMHELVYFQIRDKEWLGLKWMRNVAAKIYRFFESVGVRVFDKIVLAEDGYKSYFVKNYPKRLNKIVYVRNYPRFDQIRKGFESKQVNDKLVLIYAGGLTKIRGIKEVCDAVKDLSDVELKLMGTWQDEEYKISCLKNNKNVKDFGLLPLPEVYKKIHQADIGLSTLYPVQNYLTSLPVKSFEYMACAVPILMSDFPFWKSTYKECAVFVDPTSVDEIKEKVIWCKKNREQLKRLGENGYQIGKKKYRWVSELNQLVEVYKQITD
ncbi:MAG: glycosyltransferase [Crocinitomicaceae bacterium]